MSTNSNQFTKKSFLLFCGSLLVCSSAFVGFSDKAFAKVLPQNQIHNTIANKTIDSREAAREIGVSDYQNLQGNQNPIRLNQSNQIAWIYYRRRWW